MTYNSWYKEHFESRLTGRYVRVEDLNSILNTYKDNVEVSISGYSELGNEIPLLKIGTGKKIVLGWSQMHGNESTTTKAIMDFLKFLSQKDIFQKEIGQFLEQFSFYIIPILNPDGSALYTRENANLVDLNRDAKNLSQSESKVLRATFNKIKPDLCLNLHDQRSIYGFDSGIPATVSFLAPAADKERSITASRKSAMELIVRMYNNLQEYLPGGVGRYDDAFNENCVGDTFQMAGVPTILFEAGHCKDDYQREKTREYIFYAFLSLFEFINEPSFNGKYQEYFKIPENKVNFKDLIIRNVKLSDTKIADIGIQYTEVLGNNSINFEAVVESIQENLQFFSHLEYDMKGESILINSQEIITVGQKVSNIIRKSDFSVLTFQK